MATMNPHVKQTDFPVLCCLYKIRNVLRGFYGPEFYFFPSFGSPIGPLYGLGDVDPIDPRLQNAKSDVSRARERAKTRAATAVFDKALLLLDHVLVNVASHSDFEKRRAPLFEAVAELRKQLSPTCDKRFEELWYMNPSNMSVSAAEAADTALDFLDKDWDDLWSIEKQRVLQFVQLQKMESRTERILDRTSI